MSKAKETFLYKSQNFVNINGNSKMHSVNIKNGKGEETDKTYQNGKLKSSKTKTLKSGDIKKLKRTNIPKVPLLLPLFGGIRTRRYKYSRSKTHKKRRR
jgi:hypothetical protein